MNRTALLVAAALVCGVVSVSGAVSPPLHEEFELLTAKGAAQRKVRTYDGRTSLKQLDYEVELEFPAAAIEVDQLNKLKDLGWKQCSTRTAEWDSIPDNRDKTNPQCMYVLSRSFIKANNLMRITMQYQTNLTKKWYCAPKPDNSRQFVNVSVYFYPKQQAMRLKEQGLACPE